NILKSVKNETHITSVWSKKTKISFKAPKTKQTNPIIEAAIANALAARFPTPTPILSNYATKQSRASEPKRKLGSKRRAIRFQPYFNAPEQFNSPR
ncbi:MAG: hypothetical protein IKY61_00400, partial [Thermoguttaceae bacterium]|nr:hypothetical protein [Thermoguttaceae bacterium]